MRILFGLSPLARGTHHERRSLSPVGRFIPAGAGNSADVKKARFLWPVYPRWRGELHQRLKVAIRFLGLSPLARGTRKSMTDIVSHNRFIPAGAGNSLKVYICS